MWAAGPSAFRAARLAILIAALAATARRAGADDGGLVLRPVVGIAPLVSARGLGLGAHLGLRLDQLVLRASLDTGHMGTDASGVGTSFAIGAVRASIIVWERGALAVMVGAGFGVLDYGILGDRDYQAPVLLPEVGLLLGGENWLGRIFVTVTGVIPLRDPSVSNSGFAYLPPLGILAVLLSL